MRGLKVRFAVVGVLAVLCAGLVTWGGHHIRGQVQPLPGQVAKDKDPDKKDARADDFPFQLPEERDARNQLKAARDYLEFKEIPWKTVCPLLQNILDARSDSFFRFEEKDGPRVLVRRISVKTEANRIIAQFPKEGLQFYQQLYGQEAARLLGEAVKNNYDLATLSDLSQRYFHTAAGGEATVLLGTLQLERGNYLEAAYAFERLLTRPASDDLLTPRTLFKAALAFRRSGDPKHAELARTTWEKIERPVARDGLVIGRRAFNAEQLRAELERPVEVVRPLLTVDAWAMRYGNAAHNATVEGGPPFLDPAFKPVPMLYTPEDQANEWIKDQLNRLFARDAAQKSLPLPAFFPLTAPDLVVYRSYNGVFAVATRDHVAHGKLVRAGEVRWVSKSDFGLHQLLTPGQIGGDVNARNEVISWWGQYQQTGVSSILYENPLLGSLAHDGQNVYYVDDVAVPPPPPYASPEFGGPVGGPQFRPTGQLAKAVEAGRLVAVNLQTGKLAWELGRLAPPPPQEHPRPGDPPPPPPPPIPPRLTEEDADKATSAFQLCLDAVFLGPPLPLNGRLYVLIEQAGSIRLLCLDPRTLVPGFPGRQERVPALLWSQKLGKPNTPLPTDSIRRYQGAFLAAGEGIIVCPTNGGALIAVDVMSRSLLWAHAYDRPTVTPTRPTFDPNTGRPRLPEHLPQNRWRAAAPIIANGRVLVAAYDSISLECLDLRTGRLLWKVPKQEADLYVGGVANDKVIVVGKNQVRAFHLTRTDPDTPPGAVPAPVLAWTSSEPIPNPTGHGALGKTAFFVPVRQDTAGKDSTPAAEIWAVDIETGKVTSKPHARKRNDNADLARFGIGNLVFQDGMVFAQSAWEVAAYPQLDEKRREMDRRLAANPKDPVGLTDKGELDLDDGKLKEAIAAFKEAQRNDPPEGVRWRIREKLYTAYTELLRSDFAAGEPFLEEYKGLCEVPAVGEEDPDEKARRADETLRRQRLYLYLLARGREDQGRLGDAFDHYLALANLGEGKTLLEMPDEPNVRMRPDVWARGRIEGMIRKAADPAARKSLEDRVSREWEEVRSGGDLARLREFVGVFGPYFPAGSAAQLNLAERLLGTGDEADAREAQMHLAQLRVTADDPATRARATESLARLMVKNGMMEDAVGLYLQLGKDYPDVVVRDGKTGAEFLTDLLTDKRLLPYLEPSRYPLPPRVRAVQETAAPGGVGAGGTSFEVDPEGELFPMFRRLRFTIDMTVAGNGTWTVRAFDRVTGAERGRFGDLQPLQVVNTNPGTIQLSRFVQANGQLLLVQLGTWVHCLDLAEKKERWRKNLLGDGFGVGPNPADQNTDIGPDGEVTVKFAEGYFVTLGKAAVLQPGYVCLLTRDGLEVIEPLTRRQLWTRRGVAERTQVYGDARYVVLVETGADRKPVRTQLLRAVDGMPAEGAPDAGRVLANARSYRIAGRTALLTEGAGDHPRVLRLYDLATGKDVWREEYPAGSVPLRPLDPDRTGFVRPTGEVDVLDTRTGHRVAKLQIDTKNLDAHLKGCQEAQLLADADRYYVVLDQDPAGGGDRRRVPAYSYSLRTQRVNGPMYAFDRASGKRLWYAETDVLADQLLILEQFQDLPVVIAAAPQRDRNNVYSYKVVVLEKDRGKLVFDRAVPYNGNFFQTLQVDLRSGTIDLHRYDLRIHVSPDPEAAPARP